MFFFSNFLKICDEDALWKVFRRWGSVCEVFITRRRSKVGQCYGFFRFHKVENVEHLAYQLDKIIVGCIKMRFNLPRFAKQNGVTSVENAEVKRMTKSQKEKGKAIGGTWRR